MATFEVEVEEGMRWIRVDLDDDDVRTERGALNHFKGAITMSVPLPTPRAWWADEGLLWYKTALEGDGKVVLAVDGPVEEVERVNDRLVADGPFVIARTAGLTLSIRRPARSLVSSWLSGQKRAFVYEGTGNCSSAPSPTGGSGWIRSEFATPRRMLEACGPDGCC